MAEIGSKIPNECIQFLEKPYQEGTIKLTWIDPNDYKTLHSRMFNSVEEALANLPKESLGNNWLIFKLTETDGNSYLWEVLPYGKHKGYVNGMKIRDNKLLYFGGISLMILGAYFVISKILKK